MKSFFEKSGVKNVTTNKKIFFDNNLKNVHYFFHARIAIIGLRTINVKLFYKIKKEKDFNLIISNSYHIQIDVNSIHLLPNNLKLTSLSIYNYNGEYIDKEINTVRLFVYGYHKNEIKFKNFKKSNNLFFLKYNPLIYNEIIL